MLGQVCLQELANPFEFRADLVGKLGGVSELTLEALPFEFAHQRHQPSHPASGAGARATMGQPSHFRGRACLNGGFELLDLRSGLVQVKSCQFPQIVLVAISEIQQSGHVNGVILRRRGGRDGLGLRMSR